MSLSNAMALDVGAARIGVAIANNVAKIASPLTFISNDSTTLEKINQLIQEHNVAVVVVGLPRGLSGQDTDQTRSAEAFTEGLKKHLMLPVFMQDEALTSKQAEAELDARGKKYQKGDVDALAACYILSDFISEGNGW